jgi:hypothetical protein
VFSNYNVPLSRSTAHNCQARIL